MARRVREAQFDYRLRGLAEKIIASCWPHDYLSEYAAILNWVRANMRYSRDPRTVEQLKTPAATVETGTGDCDDLSTLIGALVGLVGGQVRFVAAGFATGPRHPQTGEPVLSHVWLEAFDPVSGAWVVLDPVPGRLVGQMLGRVARRQVMEVLT